MRENSLIEYEGWDKTDKMAAIAKVALLRTPLIVLAEQGRAEALSPVAFLIKNLAAIGLTVIVVTFLVGSFFARSIATPISLMSQSMLRLAGGDQTIAIAATCRKDEIGHMANAVQAFKAAAIEKTGLESAAAAARIKGEQERRCREQEAAAVKAQEFVVTALSGALGRLSEGDLSFEISETFKSEYEKNRHDFNTAIKSFARQLC